MVGRPLSIIIRPTLLLTKCIVPMAEKTKALILKLLTPKQAERDERTYREADVKQLLYDFARDIGCKWRAQKLRKFIEDVFDFD